MKKTHGTRIGEKEFGQASYWADGIADYLIQKYPDKNKFVCASGISPSGAIHFGNFREVITTFAVVRALQKKGKEVKFIYSWDNFDRFRKVPADIDPSYKEHIGKALSDVPAPIGKNISYAQYYQREFEDALKEFNIPVSYRYQTELYTAGVYDSRIVEAMRKRKEIADILLEHMTDKGKENKGITDEEYRENYYPISIYSRFTRKDATKILRYNGGTTVRYRCEITGKEEEVDLSKDRIAKLNWKVDWAMRWKHENVCFEPGGSDHAALNGSYEVSSAIAKNIFGIEPPVFTEYGFVGLRGLGAKMSGSSGKNITPKKLLGIYEPVLLLWMYLRRLPAQTFSLSFDTEVYRQYDEMDTAFRDSKRSLFSRLFKKNNGTTDIEKQIVEVIKNIHPDSSRKNPIPFRQIVGLAQIVGWDETKLKELLRAADYSFDSESVSSRLPKAKTWVTEYNRDAMITLREKPNEQIWETVDKQNRQYIQKLREYIEKNREATIEQIETFIYSLPKEQHIREKELKKAQRLFFKHVYQLLITKDSGPRLSTFIWATPKEIILKLINKEMQNYSE